MRQVPHRLSDATASRLGLTVLAYLTMAVAIITLAPFRFASRPVHGLTGVWSVADLALNVVLFIPLGFAYQLSRPRDSRAAWLAALALGAVASGGIEVAQFFSPERYPSLVDLATNAAGAALGTLLYRAAVGRVEPGQAVRTLALELPLMGVVYVLVPLGWVSGLGSEGGSRGWLVVPLAACAGWILASVHQAFAAPRQGSSRFSLVLGAGAWFAVTVLPGGLAHPQFLVAGASALSTALVLRLSAPDRFTWERVGSGHDARRFEAPTLRVAIPVFALYMALAAILPWPDSPVPWSGTLALLPVGTVPENAVIFRALEYVAAFTVAGYMVAEYLSRSSEGMPRLAVVLLGGAALAAGGLELLRGWHPAYGASGALFLMAVASAGLGGRLYGLQLAHVRALTARD